jgi:hypothetical protein
MTPRPGTRKNENTRKIDISFVGILYLIIETGLDVAAVPTWLDRFHAVPLLVEAKRYEPESRWFHSR